MHSLSRAVHRCSTLCFINPNAFILTALRCDEPVITWTISTLGSAVQGEHPWPHFSSYSLFCSTLEDQSTADIDFS